MTTRTAAAVATAFVAAHLPFLPVQLEDLDSVNFALALRTFDVAQHQPHPPGYPLFIAAGRLVERFVASEVLALSLVSVIAAALAVVLVVRLFESLRPARHGQWMPIASATVVATAPLYWMTAARPLSDMAGLAASVWAQVLLLRSSTPAALGGAAFVAGAAVGLRSQVVWLTVPVLLMSLWRARRPRQPSILAAGLGYGAGISLWAIPLVWISGGVGDYLRALGSQGAEDFAGVAMLATQPSPRLLVSALYFTCIAPWGSWWLGGAVMVIGSLGLMRLATTDRAVLGALLVLFGPYAVFHLLFQETTTTRYALPLVVPTGYLVAAGLSFARDRVRDVAVALVALAGLSIGMVALRSYAAVPAPGFKVLEDMAAVARSLPTAPTLAMHRRQELDMRRPVLWNRDRLPTWSARLPAPAKHEWLELVNYWNAGGRAPVWFLADPPRSDLRLIDPRSLVRRGEYRWSFDATDLIGGVRPNVMDWYEIQLPTWYLGEGWALTPEAAGVAKDEGKGPGRSPIQGWIRRHDGPATLMIGGRSFAPANSSIQVTVSVNDHVVLDTPVASGFFLKFVALEAGTLVGEGDVTSIAVKATSDDVAIEQFDIQPAGSVVYGFGEGWHEHEYNPRTGRLWRWTSDRAALRVRSARRGLTLGLHGEFETSAPKAHVVVRAGERVIAERDLDRQFHWDVPVPADAIAEGGETLLTIETDQWYVPAETNWRPTQDRRRLGLRLFECELRPAS